MGVGPHTISVPRIRPADDINPADFANAISGDIFAKIVTVLRITVSYTGMIVSIRESQNVANGYWNWGCPRSAAVPDPVWEVMKNRRRRRIIWWSTYLILIVDDIIDK